MVTFSIKNSLKKYTYVYFADVYSEGELYYQATPPHYIGARRNNLEIGSSPQWMVGMVGLGCMLHKVVCKTRTNLDPASR